MRPMAGTSLSSIQRARRRVAEMRVHSNRTCEEICIDLV